MTDAQRDALVFGPFPPIGGYKGMLATTYPRSYTWAGTIIGDNFQGGAPRTRKADEGGFTADTREETL